MNMASNAMPGPWTTAEISPFRQLCWSVRRELWENRYIYLAPSIAGAVFLIGFAISLIAQRLRAGAIPQLAAHDLLNTRYELSAALIMGVTIIVGIFYSFDALYGERRDRSILFWKSLPVSDFTVVISKLLVPLVVLPFVSFMVSIATHFLMLLLSSAILLGSGVSVTTLWSDSQLFRVSLLVFYHLLTVHGLWYAPLYGWLLMVSAWARRAPFLWAVVPPFIICGVEKIAFNSTNFLALLEEWLLGTASGVQSENASHDFMASLVPHHFLTNPKLWVGLLLAVLFLSAAVQLRRRHGPI